MVCSSSYNNSSNTFHNNRSSILPTRKKVSFENFQHFNDGFINNCVDYNSWDDELVLHTQFRRLCWCLFSLWFSYCVTMLVYCQPLTLLPLFIRLKRWLRMFCAHARLTLSSLFLSTAVLFPLPPHPQQSTFTSWSFQYSLFSKLLAKLPLGCCQSSRRCEFSSVLWVRPVSVLEYIQLSRK